MTTFATHGKTNIQHLNELVNVKETEWRSLLQQQLDSLLKELAEREEELRLHKLRFGKLKTDFEYNLNLLAERDKELDEYEKVFQQLKANDALRNGELSEMKIKLDEAEKRYDYSQKEKEELQRHYHMRLKGYQDEVNSFYMQKDQELQQEKITFENSKKELQRKVREVEEDSAFSQQRLLQQFDEKLKEKDQEFQETLEKKDMELHSFQLKIKMVSKELEMLRTSTKKVEDTMESNKVKTVQMERQLKQKDWELEDTMNMKDLEIKELKEKIRLLSMKNKNIEEEFSIKSTEMEKLLNERQQQMALLKDAANETEESMRDEIRNLKQKNEELFTEMRKMTWNTNDQLKARDFKIKCLHEKVANLESSLKVEIENNSKAKISKDLELETLKSSQSQLYSEKKDLRDELDRMKKDLNTLLHHEKVLENANVQLELDWRKRLETRESEIYNQHEELIRNLTTAKDEAISTCNEKEEELTQQQHLLKMLQIDKNTAVKMLQKHDVDINGLFTDSIPTKDEESLLENLREQNLQLKEVIKQMRMEMEALTRQSVSESSAAEKKSDYIEDLEAQVRNLKATNRELGNKIEDLTKDRRPPSGRQHDADDQGVKKHLKELNETIGFLRNEKVQLTVFVTSKDAKIRHLQKRLSECENEKQQQQLSLDNMKHDAQTQGQIDHQTVATLKERVSQLELQLEQARSEAEVYYKSVMERNMEAMQFSKQFSEMKLKNPELSTKIHHVHMSSSTSTENIEKDGEKVRLLKSKLKLAVERIRELMKEREKLINAGNRLRAELTQFTQTEIKETERKDVSCVTSNVRQLHSKLTSKLDALEQFHYQNTEKQLKHSRNQHEDPKIIVEIDPESTEDESLVTNEIRSIRSPGQITSSDHSSSIREVWKLLEQDDISIGSSKHSRAAQNVAELEVSRDKNHKNVNNQDDIVLAENRQSGEENFGIEIVGQRYSGNIRERTSKHSTRVLPKKEKKLHKIRNYNDKT